VDTTIDEVVSAIYRISTYIPEADLAFNQYLIDADEPLLFHCGMRALFPAVSGAVASVIPLSRLRWISFGHWEADESGAMNDWLGSCPDAQVAVGKIGCMLSVGDIAIRAPRVLADGETLDLGGKLVRYLSTPHVPHCWDAGVMMEESTGLLLCGDLFTRNGRCAALSADDPVGPAIAAEETYGATALTPQTGPTIRRLAMHGPRALGLMHGPVFNGACGRALDDLAGYYAKRAQQ
jgi:flavorubredoxin